MFCYRYRYGCRYGYHYRYAMISGFLFYLFKWKDSYVLISLCFCYHYHYRYAMISEIANIYVTYIYGGVQPVLISYPPRHYLVHYPGPHQLPLPLLMVA